MVLAVMVLTVGRSIGLNGSPGLAQLVVAIVFGILATVAVILRIASRIVSKANLSICDYTMVFALVRIAVYDALIEGVVAGGAGQHKHRLTEAEVSIYWKAIYAINLTWPIAQSTTKISILLFYTRLFPSKVFRIAARTLVAIVSIWGIEQILATLLMCRPISRNWRIVVDGHCGNVTANLVAGAGISTLTDFIILLLPMRTIWRLQVPFRNKISLSLIFGLGSLICIISVIRLRALSLYVSGPTTVFRDATYNNNRPILYTVLESSLGVICACVIIMKPLFSRSRLLGMMDRKSNATNNPKTSTGNGRRASAAVNGANASWELALQRSRFQDMQILKQYENQGLDGEGRSTC
ncbi:MAG: hypothetical protein Q9216_000158 [Gyalolechia sp. 2 TL-2023]